MSALLALASPLECLCGCLASDQEIYPTGFADFKEICILEKRKST